MIRNSNLVQSLMRGLVGLEMAAEGEVSPQELADRLGIDRSSAYRLLYTLMECGYLTQAENRKFIPNGGKFVAIFGKVAGRLDWMKLANQYMEVLAEETGETANLGVVENNYLVYIGQAQSDNAVRVYNAIGTRRPLHSSSLGKAYLAFLDEPRRSEIIDMIDFTPITPKTITNPELFRLHLEMVRRNGYAFDDEETFEGVRCLAAPVFDHKGKIIAAMGISGPTSRVTLERLPFYSNKVVEIARELSRNIGYSEPAAQETRNR